MAKCKLPGDECRHDGGCDTCKYAEDEAHVETITGDPMIHGVAPEGGDDNPGQALIDSMAMRFDHSFMLMPDAEKDVLRRQMRQVWEEVAGKGFYKHQSDEADPVLKLIDGERKKMRDVLAIDGIGMTKDTAVHSYATVDCMLYLIRTAYLASKNGGPGK